MAMTLQLRTDSGEAFNEPDMAIDVALVLTDLDPGRPAKFSSGCARPPPRKACYEGERI